MSPVRQTQSGLAPTRGAHQTCLLSCSYPFTQTTHPAPQKAMHPSTQRSRPYAEPPNRCQQRIGNQTNQPYHCSLDDNARDQQTEPYRPADRDKITNKTKHRHGNGTQAKLPVIGDIQHKDKHNCPHKEKKHILDQSNDKGHNPCSLTLLFSRRPQNPRIIRAQSLRHHKVCGKAFRRQRQSQAAKRYTR